MYNSKKSIKRLVSVFLVLVFLVGSFSPTVHAATTPDLGMAETFVILSDTYTNTAPGTTLNGDLGYSTGPALAPTVNGATHDSDGTYSQAGIDQGVALVALNSQPCDFSYAPGAVDLASNVTTPDGVGQFSPGIYCINGAASIGGGGTITLTGAGTYIFRITGAFTSSANSVVTLASGASACDIFWTPGAATTLGADSIFVGTDIDASGITIGNNVTWTGRALAFGGTVSTDVDTVSAPDCTEPDDDDDGSSGGVGTDDGSADGSAEGSLAGTGVNSTVALMFSIVLLVAGSSLYRLQRKQNS